MGDRREHVCEIFDGYRVVFSIEEHLMKSSKQTKLICHCSISVSQNTTEDVYPSEIAWTEILKKLGFKKFEPFRIEKSFIPCVEFIEEYNGS